MGVETKIILQVLAILLIPILGIYTWFQRTKVDRNTCERVHSILDQRLKDMHQDIREIRNWIRKNGNGIKCVDCPLRKG